MINVGTCIMLCVACLMLGFMLGDWKEGQAVTKMADDLSLMHYKEIQLIVDKILKSHKEKKE